MLIFGWLFVATIVFATGWTLRWMHLDTKAYKLSLKAKAVLALKEANVRDNCGPLCCGEETIKYENKWLCISCEQFLKEPESYCGAISIQSNGGGISIGDNYGSIHIQGGNAGIGYGGPVTLLAGAGGSATGSTAGTGGPCTFIGGTPRSHGGVRHFPKGRRR